MRFLAYITLFLALSCVVINSQPTLAASATMTFSPQTQSVAVGAIPTLTININSGGVAINRVYAKITYPSNLITPQSISLSNSFIDTWYENGIGTGTGTMILSGGVSGSGANGTQLELARINFEARAVGVVNISFSTDSGVFQQSDGQNILSEFSAATVTIVTPSPTPSPSVTPRATPTPSTSIPPTSLTPTSLTPTPSNLPIAGDISPTITVVLFSLLSVTFGLIILRKL